MPVPFDPAPAVAPSFDPATGTWTLSRDADVSAALSEDSLLQGSKAPAGDFEAEHRKIRSAVQADLGRMDGGGAAQAARSFGEIVEHAHRGGTVDLVRGILHPWTVKLLTDLNGEREAMELAGIAEQLLFGHDSKDGPEFELEQMIESGTLSVSKSMFFGLTQTCVSFLAKAWLALLENPGQAEMLRQRPELIGNASEELLRFAGPVHTLYRWASRDVTVNEAAFERGQKLALRMDSANYDPARFADADRLDLTRATAGHLGLGRGIHACVGSVVVRIATRVATPLFVAAGLSLGDATGVCWKTDKTLQWPDRVPVRIAGNR